MTKTPLLLTFLVLLGGVPLAHAAGVPIPQPLDLPPGAMNFDSIAGSSLMTDPNIIAAVIGVAGLLVGSLITILATYVIRIMDIRREDRREDILMERSKKEKEYHIKQEIYRDFLNELAQMEAFENADMDALRREWTKMEVKVDLVASSKVRTIKEKLQEELMTLSEKNLKSKSASLPAEYVKTRDELLSAIREDIDIFQSK